MDIVMGKEWDMEVYIIITDWLKDEDLFDKRGFGHGAGQDSGSNVTRTKGCTHIDDYKFECGTVFDGHGLGTGYGSANGGTGYGSANG
jgi:hypothetical protein